MTIPTPSPWICVTDRLPPPGKLVIVCGQKWYGKQRRHVMPGWRLHEWDRPRYKDAQWAGTHDLKSLEALKNVTHWMPMLAWPTPPE